MRSAICISGLARTYRKTYESFMHNVVGPLKERGEVDIFISIWDTVDLAALSSRAAQEEKVNVSEIMEMYQPKALDVESFTPLQGIFHVECLLGTGNAGYPASGAVKNGILTAAPAQYKVLRCNALKISYEQLCNFQYDCVIRTRFDIEIAPFRIDEMDLSKVNCLYDQDGLVGDYFYIANSGNMDILTRLFIYYRSLLSIEGTDMGPERNLKNYMLMMNLQSNIIVNHSFSLVRDSFRQDFNWDEETHIYIPSPPPSIELPMDKYSNVEINLEDIGEDYQTTIDGLNSIYQCCLPGQRVVFEGYSDDYSFRWAKLAIEIFLRDKVEKLTINNEIKQVSFIKL